MKYFRLLDEVSKPRNRWFLKSLNVVDENKISVWSFVSPMPVKLPNFEKLRVSVRKEGKPLDFTFADFEVLIVNDTVVSLLSEKDCQLIPVEVDNLHNDHTYFILVLLNTVDCLDENRSVFEKWQADDTTRPDLAGNYKGIYKLFVNATKITLHTSIFRLAKSDNVIIVNEELKKTFESNRITGVKFQEIS